MSLRSPGDIQSEMSRSSCKLILKLRWESLGFVRDIDDI